MHSTRWDAVECNNTETLFRCSPKLKNPKWKSQLVRRFTRAEACRTDWCWYRQSHIGKEITPDSNTFATKLRLRQDKKQHSKAGLNEQCNNGRCRNDEYRVKNVQFSRQRSFAERALKNKWQNKSQGSFYSRRKLETAEEPNPQISSGVSDVPPRRLAATLSRLDIMWWRSNTAGWQLLSVFSSCLESTLRGTNEKLAGVQKRSPHGRRRGASRPLRCFLRPGADGSAQAAPGKCHISTPRCRSAPAAALWPWGHSHRILLETEMFTCARKTTPSVPPPGCCG